MQKNVVKFEVEKNQKKYHFECEPSSPLGEIFDALCEMQHYVMGKMKELAPKKEEPKEAEEKVDGCDS